MKKLLFSIAALVIATVSFAQDKKKADDIAKFKTETIDLGKIQQGNPTTAIFSVANIGAEPLIIEQANPTCGCTISDYTKEPIANGKTGTIKATYNAANVGAFEKHLTVKFAGVDEIKSITIKGEVLTKDDFAKQNPAAAETAPKQEATATPVAAPAPAKVAPTPAKTKTAAKKTAKAKRKK